MLRTPLIMVILALHISPLLAETTITLEENQTYQVMSGWECTTYIADPCAEAYEAVRDTVLALAVDDVGINRVRLEVRSGAENDVDYYQNWVDDGCPEPPDPLYYEWRHNRYATVNDNEDPGVINWAGFNFTELDHGIETVVLPMRERLQANSESLYVNLCYVAFTSQIEGGDYHHDDPAEYGEFVLAAHLHMQQIYDFVPNSWEVVLEPDNVSQWNGTLLGQAIVAAAARLRSNGFDTRFVAPSNSTMSNILEYIDDMLATTGAPEELTMLSYHRYGADDATLQQIVDRALLYGLDTGMLEWWFGNATYEVLHKDITLGRNSAWQGRTLRSLFVIDDSDPDNITVDYNIDTMYNRQYFKFVRAGALRIEASSSDEQFSPVAFINPDGTWLVVVKASTGGDLVFEGLPEGTYGVKYTTGDDQQAPIEYDVDLEDITIFEGEPLETGIPAQGLITVYGKLQGSSGVEEGRPEVPSPLPAESYPNPFRSTTTIRYAVPEAGVVSLAVYDVSGAVVSAWAPGVQPPGEHEIIWDTDGRPSGVYFCEIRLDGRRLGARRIVLSR